MSIKEENLIQYSGNLMPGQRLVKVGNTFIPVGVGGAFEPGSGGGGSNNMKFYKCASVDTTAETWSGYELLLQDGVYVVSDVLTENLKYTVIMPRVESYYSEDGLLQLKDFYNGIVLVSPTGMTSAENDEWVISASSEYGSRWGVGYCYEAFSGSEVETYGWISGVDNSFPHYIQWQNKIRKASISSYSMQVNGWVDVSNRERFPCSWELQGSVNGNDWVTVDSRTDAFSSVDELKTWQYYTFTCQNPGYYSYYRIYVTGVVNRNESNYVYIGQIKAYGQFEYGESNETPPESSSKPYGYRLKMSHYDLEPVWKREFIQDDLTATGKARTWTCTDDSSVKLMYTEDFGGWTQVSTSAEGELVPDRTGFGTGDDPYPCFDEMGVAEITVIE